MPEATPYTLPATPDARSVQQLTRALHRDYGLLLLGPPERLPSTPDVERYSCSTNAGPFVVHYFTPGQHEAALTRSIELVESLVSSGFPTAAPLTTRHGAPLVRLGNRFAALFHAVEGQAVGTTAPEIRAIGHTIGRLHFLCSYEDDATLAPLPAHSTLVASLARLTSSTLSNAAATVAQEIGERLDYVDIDLALPSGILHGALSPTQLVRSADGTVYLIDSEGFTTGPLLLDLGLIAASCCTDGVPQEVLLAELIEGYSLGARRRVTMAEWRALPMVLYYGALLLSVEQLATRGQLLGKPEELPAWQAVLGIEEAWDALASRVVLLGHDQLAPEGNS